MFKIEDVTNLIHRACNQNKNVKVINVAVELTDQHLDYDTKDDDETILFVYSYNDDDLDDDFIFPNEEEPLGDK